MNLAPIRVAILSVVYKAGDWSGRATRSEFWWWFFFQYVVIVFVLLGIAAFDIWRSTSEISFNPYLVALQLCTLVVIAPNISVTIRRLRDAGYSTKFAFLALSNVLVFLLTPWLIKPSADPNVYKPYKPPRKGFALRMTVGFVLLFLLGMFFSALAS